MFFAVKSRRYGAADVFEKLVKTPGAWNKGGHGHYAPRPTASVRRNTSTSEMGRDLMEAATNGDFRRLSIGIETEVLLGTNAMGNNCLHVAAMRGHQQFCVDVLGKVRDVNFRRLLSADNTDRETPLLVAVASGHTSLASDFFDIMYPAAGRGIISHSNETILKQDKHGCNVLHHAIRGGHLEFAQKLINKAPADLSHAVNIHGESPIFIAAMRDYEDVFVKLLENNTPDAACVGAGGYNVLHAAVRNGNSVIADHIIKKRGGRDRELATEENMVQQTPVHLAVFLDQVDVLKYLLNEKPSLGYAFSSAGDPLLNIAARRGQVRAAEALLEFCPDAPYATQSGWTCLHQAVQSNQLKFVKFVLKSPQLRKLVNMRDGHGRTPMHHTVLDCKPQMLEALLAEAGPENTQSVFKTIIVVFAKIIPCLLGRRLRHTDTDVTMLTSRGHHASWTLGDAVKSAKSLRWNEVSKLLLRADPNRKKHISDLHKEILGKITDESRKNIKALTETYIRNTSVVAILMASISFAAAFAFSGWYRTDDAITAKKSLRAFFILDSLAMCLSLFVAFISVIARWEDLEFLLCYRKITRTVMWVAYMVTIAAFATGLYTLLAPRLLWLAILICCLPVLVLALTCLFHTWLVPRWVRTSSETDLVDMV